jgi:hypothetical protein
MQYAMKDASNDDEQRVALHRAGGDDLKAFRGSMIEAALLIRAFPSNKRLRILRRAYADTDVATWALAAALDVPDLRTDPASIEKIKATYSHEIHLAQFRERVASIAWLHAEPMNAPATTRFTSALSRRSGAEIEDSR